MVINMSSYKGVKDVKVGLHVINNIEIGEYVMPLVQMKDILMKANQENYGLGLQCHQYGNGNGSY